MRTKFEIKDINFTKKLMLKRANLYEKNLIQYLKKFRPKYFDDYINFAKKYSKKIYKKKIFGFKSNWCNEFSYSLLKKHPNVKIIFIVRDPRSVINSKLGRKIKYPILPMIYQWRKGAGIMLDLKKNHNINKNIYICKYEDLILDTGNTLKKIFKFLSVKNINKYNLDKIYDANNKVWTQNSSFLKKQNSSFSSNKKSLYMWKKKLNKSQIKLIENLCFYEMKALSYDCKKNDNFFKKYYPYKNLEKLPFDSKFIKYLDKNYHYSSKLFDLEKTRYNLINKKKTFSKKMIKKFFLKEDIYKILKNANSR